MASGVVLFVCTGNTCRSPLAAAVAADFLKGAGQSLQTRSAGTGALDGVPASDLAVRVAAEAGLDLHTHRARAVTRDMVEGAALVLAMTRAHAEALRRLAPAAAPRVHELCDYAEVAAPGGVADPVGGDLAAYRGCLQEIRHLVERSLERFLAEGGSREPRTS